MKAVFVVCMVLVLAQAQKAEAFSDTAKFELPAVEGGGGGRFFTGSPPDGYSCTVCHQGGQTPNVLVSGLPLDGFQPGTTYEIAVTFDQPELSHALALEFVTEAGVQAGTVAFPDNAEADPAAHCAQDLTLSFAPYLMPVRGRTIVGLGDCGATALRFRFTPPNEPLVAFSLGIVTSNGQGDSAGDGARQITHVLRRFGERSPSAVGATCNVDWARSDTPRPLRWFIVMLVMLALFRRRLRPTGVCGLLVATILLPGCARVAPYERGTLARRDMELGENADLTAGEEHAEAYREGSSGGGAAKGGGCGCN